MSSKIDNQFKSVFCLFKEKWNTRVKRKTEKKEDIEKQENGDQAPLAKLVVNLVRVNAAS